jgi:hypothetical protein
MSVAIEYLRDRWDASIAGAMGLHPDARSGAANTSTGSRLTLIWDSKTDSVSEDPLLLAAIRALAIWLREDDNETLRKEATGLCDMFMELYRNSSLDKLDFRRPILVALEGITISEGGIEGFLNHEGWQFLTQDMLSILESSSTVSDESEAARGVEIVRILLPIVETEQPGSREQWMDVVTRLAAWDVPDTEQPPIVQEFQIALLQLVTALLVNTHPGMQRRYMYSTSAVLGIANRLRGRPIVDPVLREALDDVLTTLDNLR